MLMSNIREHLDILEFNNLSEDDQRDLAHMVLNNMHQDLEEWAQLREIDMGKIKKWIKTGALAAALAGAGMSAAHAQQYQHGGNFNSPQAQQMQQRQIGGDQEDLLRRQQRQGQLQQRGQDQGQFQQRGQDQGHWNQGRYQRGGNFNQDQRGYQGGQEWGRIPGIEQYQRWQHDRDEARQWARQRGGWQERPRWHEENPWAMIDIEPPEEVLYFRDNGQDIMFVPHPRQVDLLRAREMGGMIEYLRVPNWPEPIKAFVYEMDGVTYITALPGQLP
jgi:hypothetical protein